MRATPRHDAAVIKHTAKQWVTLRLHQEYLLLADELLKELHRIRSFGPIPAGTVPVITVAHNKLARLPDFVRHYRAIGVQRFIIVDHRSTDETSAFLLAQPDVELYRTEASYARATFGNMWTTGLARKYAMGRWALLADADEFLVYDGMERHDLSDLVQFIERRGETRLYAPMLDMYSREPISDVRVNVHAKLVDVAPYFDPFSAGGRTYYERSRLPNGPALFNHRRSRVFSGSAFRNQDGTPVKFHMEKFPLSKWTDKTAYCNIHSPYPFADNPSRQLAALLHFKFVGGFQEYNRAVARLGQAAMRGAEHAGYAETIERQNDLCLFHENSRLYEGPRSLIHEGFIEPLNWSR